MTKKALITGGSGFVGRHMIEALDKRGWDIVNVDVQIGEDALDFFRQFYFHYDLVVHCAYRVGGRVGIDGRNNNFAHNLQLDAAMFEWAYNTDQSAVMYFSSCAAYPAYIQYQHSQCPIPEEVLDLESFWGDPAIPFDNYGWAKQTGERLAKHYGDMGLRVHVLRPFSGCSYSQSLDYPWPAIARRAKNRDFAVWGQKGQRRDWVDIEDITGAALAVYDADERRPVNICTGVATEMGDLMKRFGRKFHGYEPEVEYLLDKPMGALYRVGNPQRMLEHYAPKKDLEQMIEETVLHLS